MLLYELDLLAVLQSNLAPLKHVDQTPRGGHHKMTATVRVPHLGADVGTTVHHTGSHSRPVGKLRVRENGLGYNNEIETQLNIINKTNKRRKFLPYM